MFKKLQIFFAIAKILQSRIVFCHIYISIRKIDIFISFFLLKGIASICHKLLIVKPTML